MRRVERGIVFVCQAVLWITTVAIFFILSGNTILRYTTGASLQWAAEVPELLFPWMVMAGIVLGAAHGAHITTSFLMDAVPGRLRRIVGVVVWLTVTGLYGGLGWATWQMLPIVHDEASPILSVPGSVTYGCVMVGMFMLALIALKSAWNVLTLGTDRQTAHPATHPVSTT